MQKQSGGKIIMKTIQELVYNLNTNYSLDCDYEETEESVIISEGSSPLISFTKDCWEILNGFCMLHHEVQKYIMDFAYTTTPKDWFTEKKYNIIIGRDSKKPMYDNQVVTTYRKNGLNDFFVNDNTHNSHLSDYDYQFTESEIEELKSTLPTNMAKIVDLGKVEVKDD